MPTSRILAGAIVAGSVAVASVFAATPVAAATLPSGQRITVIDYLDEEGASYFYEASPVDASLTQVGSAQFPEVYDLTALDVDDDGYGYALGNTDIEGGVSLLFAADANTGVLSNPLQIRIDLLDVMVDAEYCSALDYTDGIITAICYESDGENWYGYWGILDPAAAPGEAWLDILYEFSGEAYLYFESMAIDPTTGIVYATSNSEGYWLYTLSEDAGATAVTAMDRAAYGFDFDRDGQAWVTSTAWMPGGEGEVQYVVLATLDLTDGTNPFLAPFNEGGVSWGLPIVQPITVWGSAPEVPVLPATGPEGSLALGGIAAGVLLAGAILAAATLIHRRREDAV